MARLPSWPHAFFSLAQLADVTGRGVVQNRRYVRELEAAGVVERAPHVDPRYGQRSNDYTACVPAGMIGGAISGDRAFLRRSRGLPSNAPPTGAATPPSRTPPTGATVPLATRSASLTRIADDAPPVAAPPGPLAAVLREHGVEAEEVVRSVLAAPEARGNPDAALRALDALTTYGRGDVRTTLGRLFRWLVREAIAGRDQRNTVTDGPRANTAAARMVRAIDDAEQRGRYDEAARIRQALHLAGRAAAADLDRLELMDPAHQRAQALIDAARRRDVVLPSTHAPQPRELAPAAPIKDRFLARVLALPAGVDRQNV